MGIIPYSVAIAGAKQIVKKSQTSFAAGMAILPRERREGMYALYAFCRVVDDIADDSPSLDISLAGLMLWRKRIRNLFARGETVDNITTALLPAIQQYKLIEKDFQDIIDGMEMDARGPIVAPDLTTFDLYCDRVASAVGRVSMRIFGDDSARGQDVAYHLGRALQMTNILRDIAEDVARGRLYLPAEHLAAAGIKLDKLIDILVHPKLPEACRPVAVMAEHHYAEADAAMQQCIPSAVRPARMMRTYYGAIFDELKKRNWQPPLTRVTLSKPQKLWLMLKACYS